MRAVFLGGWIFLVAIAFVGECTLMGWVTGLDDVSGAQMGFAVGLVILGWVAVAAMIVVTIALIATWEEKP